ncbi:MULTISPECIES: DUF3887 domain-containing protein [unclassified Methanoculleus]|jgi:hypothetical protein|uniref:DUF3887 domain-containing protein n=1 Tax=Methanoculleus palmolei TaxID=72612 RepID=A0ABD8A803_9EURY|nr:DUF3887 domain-containing protein [Methanoculleus sp. UBA377]WOX55660.1 DUF3887 domain-containing protein [Methanoculleus palmolei]
MMNYPQVSVLAALVLLLAVSASGCMSQETVVSDERRAQVLAYADPIADNLLSGLNDGNYTIYSRDFDDEMKRAMDKAAFEKTREFITSKIGLYDSRRDPVVTETDELITVTYKAAFEREDGVDLRFVFRKDDESHRLSGLWFTSPMLRG